MLVIFGNKHVIQLCRTVMTLESVHEPVFLIDGPVVANRTISAAETGLPNKLEGTCGFFRHRGHKAGSTANISDRTDLPP